MSVQSNITVIQIPVTNDKNQNRPTIPSDLPHTSNSNNSVEAKLINSGLMLNAIGNIKIVLNNNIGTIYNSDDNAYVDIELKNNFLDIIKRDYIDKSNFRTFNFARISTTFDKLREEPNKDVFKLKARDIEITDIYGSHQIKTNISYVDTLIVPDKINEIYKIGTTVNSITTDNTNKIIPYETSIIGKSDQLSVLNYLINDINESQNRISDLYDRDYIKGISKGEYQYLPFDSCVLFDENNNAAFNGSHIENVKYIRTTKISKSYIINFKHTYRVNKNGNIDYNKILRVAANIRGVDIVYKIVRLSDYVYVAEMPEYLLENYYDNILSIGYVEIKIINNNVDITNDIINNTNIYTDDKQYLKFVKYLDTIPKYKKISITHGHKMSNTSIVKI